MAVLTLLGGPALDVQVFLMQVERPAYNRYYSLDAEAHFPVRESAQKELFKKMCEIGDVHSSYR